MSAPAEARAIMADCMPDGLAGLLIEALDLAGFDIVTRAPIPDENRPATPKCPRGCGWPPHEPKSCTEFASGIIP